MPIMIAPCTPEQCFWELLAASAVGYVVLQPRALATHRPHGVCPRCSNNQNSAQLNSLPEPSSYQAPTTTIAQTRQSLDAAPDTETSIPALTNPPAGDGNERVHSADTGIQSTTALGSTTASRVAIEPRDAIREHTPHFRILPPEIRNKVYEHLLVSSSKKPITDKQRLVGREREWIKYGKMDYKAAAGLDARIVRTCRAICAESLPVLYGRNVLSFDSYSEVLKFCVRGMPSASGTTSGDLQLGFKGIEPAEGRFALISQIRLDMSTMSVGFFSTIAHKWGDVLETEEGLHKTRFPKLDSLHIDFTGWALSDTGERLFLKHLIKGLKSMTERKKHDRIHEGLGKVTFKGLWDESTKAQLNSLLRSDGKLDLLYPWGKYIDEDDEGTYDLGPVGRENYNLLR